VTLEGLEPGVYTVTEEMQEGWVATTPTEYKITLEAGDAKTVVFGNYQEEVEIIVPPEPPGVPPEEIVEEPVKPDVPPTWEMPPYIYYAAGALLVTGGLLLGRKKPSRKRR